MEAAVRRRIKVETLVDLSGEDAASFWSTDHEITSDDPKVIATTLRAIADKYDPPQKVYRNRPFEDREQNRPI